MEIKQRLYFFLLIDLLYVIGAVTIFILKVHYLYSILLPIYIFFIVLNWQILKSQSASWLQVIQWIRIGCMVFYALLFISGVIMMTTYHYGSWETLAAQAKQYYHVPERRLEVQLLTGLSLFKFFIEVIICTHQNDQIEMLEFKRFYRSQ